VVANNTGQSGQDSGAGQAEQDREKRMMRTRKQGQDSQDSTAEAEPQGQDIGVRTVWTGRPDRMTVGREVHLQHVPRQNVPASKRPKYKKSFF
jgi:hypothetical protein